MRIAVLNRQFKATGGGAERYSIALVEQLAARHEIHVFAQQIEHEWQGVTYHRIAAPLTRPRWINQIWFALATWRATRRGFDVVHSHENTWHGQVQTVHVVPVRFSLFQGRTGVRLALRWLKVITSPRLLTYLGMEHLRYRVQDHRCVVVTSESLKVTMLDSFPQSSGMLSVVTPGVASVPGAASEMERLGARDAGGDDSAVFVDEILQQADVFVIDQLDAFSRKAAELATTKQGIALFTAVLAFAFAEFTFTATSANACHVRFLF